jgi:hypothetical protein
MVAALTTHPTASPCALSLSLSLSPPLRRQWMMHTLLLDEGDRVSISSVKLMRARSVKFKPVK